MWLLRYIVLILPTLATAFLDGVEVNDLKLFPHHVFLKIIYQNDISYYCGGAILSKNYVVTSTHCLQNAISFEVLVQALSTQDPNALYINITDITSSVKQSDDLLEFALIKLPMSLPFSDTIKPIKFIEENLEWGGTKIVIAGLARLNDKTVLTSNDFEVINTEDCGAQHGEGFLGPSYKCFLSLSSKNSSYPCFGNAGEAVLIEDDIDTWRMIGIVVKADTCVTNISGIFSNIQPTTLSIINDIISRN